jgi:hypothetical protein
MGYPIYDVAVRTSQVTSGQVLCALLPQAAAAGTGRPARLRQISISNTTATGFGVGIGLATAAGATPGAAAAPVRRGPSTYDPPAATANLYTTYATQPTAPTNYSGRFWVPGNSMVNWYYNDGEELVVMPASTPLPFGIWLLGTGQISDVTISFEE